MEKQQVGNDSRLSLDQRFSGGGRRSSTRLRHQSLDRGMGRLSLDQRFTWTVIGTVKQHRSHWVSGPLALMTSDLRLQDLSVRLSLSLCLSIAGLMSLIEMWTTLTSRCSYRHWVSGPLALVIDYL